MDLKILSTMLAATTGLALVGTTAAQANCPERLDLLKQYVDSGTFDQATKGDLSELALEGVSSEQACERIVAELEHRLNVEVREDEVVRLTGETEGDLAATATDEGGIGVEGPPAKNADQTLSAAGQGQAGSQAEAAGQDQNPTGGDQAMASGSDGATAGTIGGGLDMPRDEIDTRYGPLAWMAFDEVIGAEVVSAEGDTIGEIIGLVRERPLGDFFAVLDSGGAGYVVPINKLEMVDGDQISMAGEPADLEAMPPYDAERYEELP